jgi:hypothetical protein
MTTLTQDRRLVLCADDYAMTDGVSRAIDQLAAGGRISATSVLVTSRHWPANAKQLSALRDRIAVGLHLDLTLGPLLGSLPGLAPNGRPPDVARLSELALKRGIDEAEVAGEIERQLDALEHYLGFPPDFLDGHQHVHALPVVRDALLGVLGRRGLAKSGFLVRDPRPKLGAIIRRGRAAPKALAIAWLTRGFGADARRAGLVVNDSFAGISGFRPVDTRRDFDQALKAAGPLALVMCHPGFPDAELAALDPVTTRRQTEYDVLMSEDPFAGVLWHPARRANGPPVEWRHVIDGRS